MISGCSKYDFWIPGKILPLERKKSGWKKFFSKKKNPIEKNFDRKKSFEKNYAYFQKKYEHFEIFKKKTWFFLKILKFSCFFENTRIFFQNFFFRSFFFGRKVWFLGHRFFLEGRESRIVIEKQKQCWKYNDNFSKSCCAFVMENKNLLKLHAFFLNSWSSA